MELLGIQPTADGQQTELRIRMTDAEARRFWELARAGRLAELGISAAMAQATSMAPGAAKDHTGRIAQQRNAPPEKDRTTER